MSNRRVFSVTASLLNLRAGPTTRETPLARLSQGQIVARLDETDFFGWWWVFADLREQGVFTGYVFAEHLKPLASLTPPAPSPEFPAEPDPPAPAPDAAPDQAAQSPADQGPGAQGPGAQGPGVQEPLQDPPTDRGADQPSDPPSGSAAPPTPPDERPAPGGADAGQPGADAPRTGRLTPPTPLLTPAAPRLLTIEDYVQPHLPLFEAEFTPDVRNNAVQTIERVNALLDLMAGDGVRLDRSGRRNGVNSGWRPRSYNARVPGAAPRSNHIRGAAIDLADLDEAIDGWCMRNQHRLQEIGLWLEDPAATRGWCHLQIVQPGSGSRVFKPR